MIRNFDNSKRYKYRALQRTFRIRLVDNLFSNSVENSVNDQCVRSVSADPGSENSSYENSLFRGNFVTDPQGSYTGRPKDFGEVPVQDADDL